MGVIRKGMSISTMGLIDFRSDKERTALYARQTRNAVREQTRILTEQQQGPRPVRRQPGLIENTAASSTAVRRATLVSVWVLTGLLAAVFAATLFGIPVAIALLALAFVFQRKVGAARHRLEVAGAEQAAADWRNDTERMASRFEKLGEPGMAQAQRDLLDS